MFYIELWMSDRSTNCALSYLIILIFHILHLIQAHTIHSMFLLLVLPLLICAEPTESVGCSMPMFYFWWDVDAVTWFHLDGFFAFFLIVSTSRNTNDESVHHHFLHDGYASYFCMTWLECYVEYSNLFCRNRC